MPRKKPTGPTPRTVPKKPVKLCERGHRQSQKWRKGEWCYRCAQEDREAERAKGAVAEREAWQAKLGPTPRVLTMKIVATGRVVEFAIPKGAHGRKPPLLRRRRGPRRRVGV